MRILFLAHRLPYPPNKGEKMRALGELTALSQRHDVDLFCFYDDPEDGQYVDAVRKYCRDCYAERIPWFRGRFQALVASVLNRSFSLAFFASRTMTRRVGDALASRDYDLIFVYCSAMAQYVQHVAGIPRVLDMVDVDSNKWMQYARNNPAPLSWLWRREALRLAAYENLLAREFTTTVLCTDLEASVLSQNSSSQKIRVLTHMLDVPSFDPHKVEITSEIKARQPYIIFTGSMDYLPNVDAVCYFHQEIFPRIRAVVPEVQFAIVGRNPTRQVSQLASDPAVWVTGSVPDTRPYLRGAVAAVVPLRIACGLQSKILEAMSMGLPTIATPQPAMALPDSLRSLVMVGTEPEDFAARVVEVIRRGSGTPDEAMRGAMLGHFDKQKLGHQIESIVAEAMARGGERMVTNKN